MVEFGHTEEVRGLPPKLEVPSRDEIEGTVRHMVGSYDGDELIERLTEFCMLSIVEVLFTQDQSPVPLRTLKEDRLVEVQKLLKPEIDPSDETDQLE